MTAKHTSENSKSDSALSLLELLISTEPQEILLVLGQFPQIRKEGVWHSVRRAPFLPSEWAAICRTLPPYEGANGQGFFSPRENLIYHFHIVQTDLLSKIHMVKRMSGHVENFHLPNLFYETLHQDSGVIVVVSPQKSCRRDLFVQASRKLGKEKRVHGLFVSRSIYPLSQEGEGLFSQVTPEALADGELRERLLAGTQVVFFDEINSVQELDLAVSIQDEQRLVIIGVAAQSLILGLAKIFQIVSAESFLLYRWTQALRLIISQIPLKSPGQRIYGSEVIAVSEAIKRDFLNLKLADLQDLLANSKDAAGLQNLNQSILHHLLKRKLDVRTAFALSESPEELDALLKKVGV